VNLSDAVYATSTMDLRLRYFSQSARVPLHPIQYSLMGYPRRTPWTVLRTPVAFVSYRRLSSQFQFSLSVVTLVYLSQCT
jgi:hypothetical protein